jgi:FdhE protein
MEMVDPSWQRWLDLVELAVEESLHPAWSGRVFVREQRSPDAPLLHESTLRVDRARASGFARRLADHLGIVALESVDALALIRIGVERRSDNLEVLAARLAVSADMVAVLGQLCALPLLLNSAKELSRETLRTWQKGYCPVCGAWPTMVEMRGIQRERRTRCGCCGSDWMLPVLRCAFCGELDHQKLGSLLSEGDEQHVRVETCTTCHGYLKSVTTLSTLPFTTLATKDLSTVTFDLAARDRGYGRPAGPGWQLKVDIVQ